jgi:phosphoribosylanthranilate isomerase
MTRIKICGITEVEHALATAKAGADYLGLVLKARSSRQVASEKAAEIVQKVRSLSPHPDIVGVFVNWPAVEVNKIAGEQHLDWVQLSGDETWEYCQDIEKPVIKTLHVPPEEIADNILRQIEQGHRIMAEHRLICLLDTQVKGTYGGTGQSFSWELAGEVSKAFPVFIAGGLNPYNVGRMLNEVRPWGVDVSSGLETNGKKDEQKIKEFVRLVKLCDEGK